MKDGQITFIIDKKTNDSLTAVQHELGFKSNAEVLRKAIALLVFANQQKDISDNTVKIGKTTVLLHSLKDSSNDKPNKS